MVIAIVVLYPMDTYFLLNFRGLQENLYYHVCFHNWLATAYS